MKICDLTQFYSPLSGGVKRYLHEKIQYIEANRPEDRHVLVIPGEKTELITRDRSRIYSIRSPLVSRSSRYRALLKLSALGEVIERERPDVIESSDPYQVGWKAAALGRALRIPVVGFYHSHFPEAYLRGPARLLRVVAEEYAAALYDRYDATLVPSAELARLLRDWGIRNVRQVSLGVNTRIFFPNPDHSLEIRRSLEITPEQKFLLYVGRLAHEKNTETLFAAFEILARQHPGEFVTLVIGDGPERKQLDRLQKSGIDVRWLQYCTDPSELARFYNAADLFVHPGVKETFGLVALESQCCGTPVVGIRGSRMDQIICHDQDSWARENMAEALAAAIVEFARRDPQAMGKRAAQAVAERYSWPNVFDEIFRIYDEIRLARSVPSSLSPRGGPNRLS